MNKLSFLFVMLSSTTFAQHGQYKISIKPYSGYELNPLKAPGKYLDSTGTEFNRSELWTNLPFAGVEATYWTRSKSKRHAFELYSNYRSSFNVSDPPVKSAIMEFGAKYNYVGKKKTTHTLKIRYRDLDKTGEDQDNLLGAPLSYNRWIFSDEIEVKLKKNWRLEFVPKTIVKTYERASYQRFMYLHNSINSQISYRYNLKNKAGYYLGINLGQRNHFIERRTESFIEDDFEEIEFSEEEDGFASDGESNDEPETEAMNRMWRYYGVSAGTKIPLNKKLKLLIDAGYAFRQDVLDENLGYGQTRLELGLQYKHDNWRLGLSTSHLGRSYTSLSAVGSNQLLRYDYLKFKGNVNYTINDRWSAFVKTEGTARVSNSNNQNSRALRSYFIGELTIGIRIVINGKYGVDK